MHNPLKVGELNKVEFHRCRCGMTLAVLGKRLWWVKARGLQELRAREDLARALSTFCHQNPDDRRARSERKSHRDSVGP